MYPLFGGSQFAIGFISLFTISADIIYEQILSLIQLIENNQPTASSLHFESVASRELDNITN